MSRPPYVNPRTVLLLLEHLLVIDGIEKYAVCKRNSLSVSFSNADLNRLVNDASKVTPSTACMCNPFATALATLAISGGRARTTMN